MACIRKRRGKYVVDYRDGAGLRRWVTCETRREAQDALAEKIRRARPCARRSTRASRLRHTRSGGWHSSPRR